MGNLYNLKKSTEYQIKFWIMNGDRTIINHRNSHETIYMNVSWLFYSREYVLNLMFVTDSLFILMTSIYPKRSLGVA